MGRFRVVGDASVEIGFFAITHALNLSAGVEVEPDRRARLGFYASAGGAVAGAIGSVQADERCMQATEECEYVPSGTMLAFGYARVGVRRRFSDDTRRLRRRRGLGRDLVRGRGRAEPRRLVRHADGRCQ